MNDQVNTASMGAPLLEFADVRKSYGAHPVLNGVSFRIGRGRIIGLLGPNGSGKTTIIKLINGLLTPNSGRVLINGIEPGVESRAAISYLPERTYLGMWMKVYDILDYFSDFYSDFDRQKAMEMLRRLNIDPSDRMKTLSKGTKEKVQLILVMSRRAQLYVLDEPIGGVDPAARDYILNTIITNYSDDASLIISTHLIADVERVLDDVMFVSGGTIALASSVEDIRENRGSSVDELFREVFKC